MKQQLKGSTAFIYTGEDARRFASGYGGNRTYVLVIGSDDDFIAGFDAEQTVTLATVLLQQVPDVLERELMQFIRFSVDFPYIPIDNGTYDFEKLVQAYLETRREKT